MIDKVQKIREEVEKLFNHVKDSTFESDSGAFYYLKDLLDLIDSLQKEPISKDLEEVTKEITKNKESAVKFLKNVGIMDENGNLAEPYRSEESVSDELEETAKKYGSKKHPMTKTGANESAYDFKEGAKWQKTKDVAKTISWLEYHVDAEERKNYKEYMWE